MKKNNNIPIENGVVDRSRELIDAQGSLTLLEEQIVAIAQSRIQAKNDRLGQSLTAELYPGELKRIISDPAHISRDLKNLSVTLLHHTYVVDDEEDPEGFQAFNLVNNCDYKNGVFKIEFNRQVERHLIGLEKNYTSLSLAVMAEFSSIYSLRLYEILKKDLYKVDKYGNGEKFEVEYDIYHLRFMIGVANNDNEEVAKARKRMGANIDYEILYNTLPAKERKYERYERFRTGVLLQAYKEMKEKADLRFEFEGKSKVGKKISSIVFTIYKNTPNDIAGLVKKKDVLDSGNNVDAADIEIIPRIFFKDFYDKYMGHNILTADDLDILIADANYDNINLVEEAILAADKEPALRNYIGWIRTYIRAKGFKDTPSTYGNSKKAAAFDEIINDMDNMDIREKMAKLENVWNKQKLAPEYDSFKKAVEGNGVSFDIFEEKYTADEKVSIFLSFKQGRGLTFDPREL